MKKANQTELWPSQVAKMEAVPEPVEPAELAEPTEPVVARTPLVVELTECHDCGGPLVFDPYQEGDTVGGVSRAGWLMCQACGKGWLSRRGVSADVWRLNDGGHSVDACGLRIRAEAGANKASVMRRIARVPLLEAALRMIINGDGDPKAIAKEALEAAQ